MSYISFRDSPHEFIITIGETKESDLQLFFQFDKQEWLQKVDVSRTHYQHFPNNTTYADIAVALQLQPSKGEARKNGWDGPVPEGYTEFKRKFSRFYILKISS